MPYCLSNLVSSQKAAFTLAEILITLGIIGIVAAMTIPTLISNYQTKTTVIKLKQARSIIANAIDLAQVENGTINQWTCTDAADCADMYYNNISKYLKITKDCGNIYLPSKLCYDSQNQDYKNLNGVRYTFCSQGYSALLSNGMGIVLCPRMDNNDLWWGTYATIKVDINGLAGPNVSGKDVFSFEIADPYSNWDKVNKPQLLPEGQRLYPEYCLDYTDTNKCTFWVLKYENMDYLKCPEKLSVNGSTSCDGD